MYLVRKRPKDPRAWMISGGIFLALAVLMERLLDKYGLPPSWNGFVDGVAVAFTVAAIALNARAAKLLDR